MRRSILTLSTLALAACSTSPESFLSITPDPIDDAYTCALRQVNGLGYTVQNADRDAGFITAEKKASGLGTAILTGKEYYDVVTVSIFDSSDTERTIRVTAARAEQGAVNLFGDASRSSGQKPSDEGRADARKVLDICGDGPVVQQVSANTWERRAVAP